MLPRERSFQKSREQPRRAAGGCGTHPPPRCNLPGDDPGGGDPYVPRRNLYGVPANAPAAKPTRRVDVVDLEELAAAGAATSFCRCFASAAFPLCDGSHRRHNAERGDNAGPVRAASR